MVALIPGQTFPKCGDSVASPARSAEPYTNFEHLTAEKEALIERLKNALGALGIIGGGYCFCYGGHRDPDKPEDQHYPECREARAVLKILAT